MAGRGLRAEFYGGISREQDFAMETSMSCQYQGFEFGANYPDSVCVDGQLFDADNCDGEGNLYEPMEEIPCPICKPKEYKRKFGKQILDDRLSRRNKDGSFMVGALERLMRRS